jgi:hypothetical protein
VRKLVLAALALNVLVNVAVLWFLYRNLQVIRLVTCMMAADTNLFDCMKRLSQ